MVAATREEPGNLTFDLYQSAANPAQFFVHESWRSTADLQRHVETPSVDEFKVRVATLGVGPIELTPFATAVEFSIQTRRSTCTA